MNLSIVIPFYDRLEDLQRCVNTLGVSSGGGLQLVIQDDASPSVSLDGIYAQGVVERNPVNVGFGANANRGVQRAAGDIVGIVNQDVYADAAVTAYGWNLALLACFDDPQVGIVAPRLLFPTGEVQSVGGEFDQRGQPVHKCLGYSRPEVFPETCTRQEVDWVTGAALFIRRDLFWQVGGFDPRYAPSYFEDVDICLKVRDLGYKVLVEPLATFYHKVGSTGGSPHFPRSARVFRELWVDTGKVKAGSAMVTMRYW